MASNSFMVKGWSLTLISLLITFSVSEKTTFDLRVLYFPAIAFLFLDVYFLILERKFRDFYEKVVLEKNTDLSIKISKIGFLDCIKAFLSFSLLIFHGIIIAMICFI